MLALRSFNGGSFNEQISEELFCLGSRGGPPAIALRLSLPRWTLFFFSLRDMT